MAAFLSGIASTFYLKPDQSKTPAKTAASAEKDEDEQVVDP